MKKIDSGCSIRVSIFTMLHHLIIHSVLPCLLALILSISQQVRSHSEPSSVLKHSPEQANDKTQSVPDKLQPTLKDSTMNALFTDENSTDPPISADIIFEEEPDDLIVPSRKQSLQSKGLPQSDLLTTTTRSPQSQVVPTTQKTPNTVPTTTKIPQDVMTQVTISPITTTKPREPNTSTELPKDSRECDLPCLNGGTCIIDEGQPVCKCPPAFDGVVCETHHICRRVIADSLTGNEICHKIGRICIDNEKFLRCSCDADEYFLFTPKTPEKNQGEDITIPQSPISPIKAKEVDRLKDKPKINPSSSTSTTGAMETATPSYTAECHKIDKCLNKRCRQLSEVCRNGVCECNRNAGYIKDPHDQLCKLIDPCALPPSDGQPICGEAKCVPTYDSDLFNCICPLGQIAIQVSSSRKSTKCVPYSEICKIPLLNKCQHICTVTEDRNPIKALGPYQCSCFPGYRAGTRKGIDDHMCFFEEDIKLEEFSDYERDANPFNDYDKLEFVYGSYSRPTNSRSSNEQETYANDSFGMPGEGDNILESSSSEGERQEASKSGRTLIKRHLLVKRSSRSSLNGDGRSLQEMTGQERCNALCEDPNKICVLEKGYTNSYRCVCDRQGYVSVGDRCLDWCSAAEFSFQVRHSLDLICYSGICSKILDYKNTASSTIKTSSENGFSNSDIDFNKLERQSSRRPTFECDCSNSPFLVQDPATLLCKLNFTAIIEPCLPGNAGYIDCVENKNAYCAVLDKSNEEFLKSLRSDLVVYPDSSGTSKQREKTKRNSREVFNGGRGGLRVEKQVEKSYSCVCSPEKQFLIDGPRNKARCINACDLLGVECGRFNRMCSSATIMPWEFGKETLIEQEPDGTRLAYRSKCECLPGFTDSNENESLLSANQDSSHIHSAYPSFISPVSPPSDSLVSSQLDTKDTNDDTTKQAKYMNIKASCFLDYDVVEFHASFRAPVDFNPNWISIKNARSIAADNQNSDSKTSSNSLAANNGQPKLDKVPNAEKKNVETSITENHSLRSISKNQSFKTDNFKQPAYEALVMPDFMRSSLDDLPKKVVFVSNCELLITQINLEAYRECVKYKYWIVQKMRYHFIDWRQVLTRHLSKTFNLMEGNIRVHVNKCYATLRGVSTLVSSPSNKMIEQKSLNDMNISGSGTKLAIDPVDQNAIYDSDVHCELTLHTASDKHTPHNAQMVLLEKKLGKFIFDDPYKDNGNSYFLMAPDVLISRDSVNLAEHRKLFNPCNSDYEYCDKQTECSMVDRVNFTCACNPGYTPIGSRDIYQSDSRKRVCEDIDECLFDACKDLADVSTCINEIGDYKCQCNKHYIGDNKRFCTHVCNAIRCDTRHGRCRLIEDHYAYCECFEGYKDTDCSVVDPAAALRTANLIICGAIFTSVLLLAITFAVSLNSKLKKTRKELKKLEALNQWIHEYPHQQFRPRMSKVST